MSKRPWFPFYTSDFERKTGHLSNEAVGAYIRLMNFYWDNNGFLPADPAAICRIVRIDRRRYADLMAKICNFFVRQSGPNGDTLLLPRLQEELERTIEISKAKALAGKKGGLANAKANAKAEKKHKPTHSHSHSHNKEQEQARKKKRAKQLPEYFELPDDWRAYCETKRDDLDPLAVFENFKDYYLGHGKAMIDWKRTWQRWVRNERSRKASDRTGGQTLSRSQRLEKQIRERIGGT